MIVYSYQVLSINLILVTPERRVCYFGLYCSALN